MPRSIRELKLADGRIFLLLEKDTKLYMVSPDSSIKLVGNLPLIGSRLLQRFSENEASDVVQDVLVMKDKVTHVLFVPRLGHLGIWRHDGSVFEARVPTFCCCRFLPRTNGTVVTGIFGDTWGRSFCVYEIFRGEVPLCDCVGLATRVISVAASSDWRVSVTLWREQEGQMNETVVRIMNLSRSGEKTRNHGFIPPQKITGGTFGHNFHAMVYGDVFEDMIHDYDGYDDIFEEMGPDEIVYDDIFEEIGPDEIAYDDIFEEIGPDEIAHEDFFEEMGPDEIAYDDIFEEIGPDEFAYDDIFEEIGPDEIAHEDFFEEMGPDEIAYDDIFEEIGPDEFAYDDIFEEIGPDEIAHEDFFEEMGHDEIASDDVFEDMIHDGITNDDTFEHIVDDNIIGDDGLDDMEPDTMVHIDPVYDGYD
ncbi:conserved hypothetical protein [Perkinsus marinus ATCC 50983]|uniref:Uncharacterized protein n=1 Tax=Perkinsus marinus (strain ATCC 50983 / TXsc) TaxID=423536 RepID=C5L751_PERM5|nr:conserved hypothetical protein [Perkinsus marinus ATCC 50983]EER07313.1 conserved hypothetical protein [Perkinsus marinus ATCC 50983]|eukprot:XP_002775497.1 conserved hypothetical protein [Perkinsus marinus ATCC 50983]